MGYIRVVTVTIALSSIVCWGQAKKELHDISPRTSPVRVSGVISVADDSSKSIRSYQVEGRFHNVSDKNVALIVVHLASDQATGPSLRLTYGEDYFFRDLLESARSDIFSSNVVKLRITT